MIKSNLAKSKKQLEDTENDAAEQIKALTEISRDRIEFETKIYETELQVLSKLNWIKNLFKYLLKSKFGTWFENRILVSNIIYK